ncbi:MAG: hypothetical protein CBC01_00530, partial [Betaproteobacteria bacterium TMED41]
MVASLVILMPTLGMIALAVNVFGDSSTIINLNNTVLYNYTINTIVLCLGTLVVSLLASIPSAWILSFYEIPFRKGLDWLSILPM